MRNHRRGRFGGSIVRTALLAIGLATLGACASTGYKPKGPTDSTGYTDMQLSPIRYRVTYTGEADTKRGVIENYLMRRAAEVTLAAGYTHFVFDVVDTRVNEDVVHKDFGQLTDGAPAHLPFKKHELAYGWQFHEGFPDDTETASQFTAYSEIVILTADEAQNAPQAISARDFLKQINAPVPPA